MNPEQLLAHFDCISDAPDAIPRLRRFILDLAVRGKLVEQDPKDEPASELLKRIQAKKARLVTEGKIRKQESARLIDEEELPFDIPPGWCCTRLATISTRIHYGFTASANQSNKAVRLLRITDIQNNSVDWSSVPGCEISEREVDQYKLERGDILIARTGGTIGKTFLVGEMPVIAVFASYLIRVQGASELDDQYLKLFLESSVYWKQLQDGARGGGQPNVNGQTLGQMTVTLPPLAEQHRIVVKVDELMALCDRLEAAQAERESWRDRMTAASLHCLDNGADADAFRDHARFYLNHLPRLTTRPEHIQQVRQTILNLAVRGRLVPQDPNDESAAKLLNRIRTEKERMLKQGKIKKQPPLPAVSPSEVFGQIPNRWEWVRLGDLLFGDSQNGYSKKPDDASDGIPILRISAGTVRRDGLVAEQEHKLIGGVSAKLQEQYRLEPGDLLACRFNGNRNFAGRLSLYSGYLGIKLIYPDKLIRLRLHSRYVLPQLVRCFGESKVVREEIERYCATTVGNWGISATNLKSVKIPLPPLAEQHRIVAKVEELLALSDRLEAQLATTQTESRRFLEAVLHEALTPALEKIA